MKEKLLNLKRLRGLMLLAVMCLIGAGTAWGEDVTYDFSEISGFSDWSTSYTKHEVAYDEATVTFASANRQTSTITDVPVTKGGDVTLVLNDDYSNYAITSVTFNCTQWGSKTQTITLYYSADGGTTYSSTGVTSSDFTISSSSLPAGTNAVKITFSSTSNQVGIASVSFTYAENTSTAVATTTIIDDSNITNTDIYNGTEAGSLSAAVKDNNNITIEGAIVTWASDNEDVATINENGVITLIAAGSTTITASYAGVENTYKPSSDTYELTVVDNTPFTGGDVTFNATLDKGTSPLVKNGVTFACDNGTLDNGTEYRLFKNSVTSFSVSEGTITQIAFIGTSSNPASGFKSQTGWTTDGNNGTWTGNAQSVSFTASGAQVRATKIIVTVDLSATPDPIITANNVEIAYDATEGSISYTIDNEPNPAGTLTASTPSGSWITLGNETSSPISFTCDANTGEERTATVTLTYTYNTNETVTKEITVTQAAAPVVYSTIPALFAAAKSTETNVNVTFDNWVVSGVSTNGKNVFVTDNEGNGFVIYSNSDMSGTFSAGNILSGTAVACDLVLYNGFAELKNLDASELTISSGGTVATANVAMADLSGVNTGALVSYENLTCSVNNSKYYLSDGTTQLQVYNSLFAFEALEDGKTYNITGVYQQYNNTKEIMPRSAADIVAVEVQHEDYTLTVSDLANVNTFVFNAADDSEILLEGEGSIEILDGTEVLISVDVEEGYILQSLIVDGTDVTSQIESGAYTFIMPKHEVTVTATAAIPTGDQYELFSGDLVEGDYIIYYDGKAMNTTVTSDRLQYAEVTPTNDVITTDKAAIVWHIAKSGDYWTIYNAEAEAYAASTGAKNKAQMLEDGTDDKVLWTVTLNEDGTYEFVNKQNTANKVNANLRNNGEYGFACYATSTGGALSLYKKVETVPVTIGAAEYATLYYSDKAFEIPEGVTAQIVTGVSDKSIEFEDLDDIIPAGTGVVLNGPQGTYDFKVVYVNLAAPENNKLKGYDAPHLTEGGDKYYKLAVKDDKVGFYWGEKNGEAFESGAHKAYLALPANEAKEMGYFFDGLVTEIRSIGTETVNGEIYTIGGVRVKADKLQKGIYIVNGKKMVVK
jgi:hypothetical protein